MSDVIKKGVLEVKKKGRFGGYKQKYVLLSNSLTKKCKMVEILDSDGSKSSVEEIRLTDVWSVQDKPSRTRYAFELIVGDDPVMTFSCATVVEREEWTEAFRVLNQLALPSMDNFNSSSPLTEYFPVTLMKNRSALEIGHSGQYLLSITSSAIVLHWKTGAIAHHWPTKKITKLYHPGREGHLLLIVKRVSGSGPPLDFEFVTEKDLAVQILKMWNIRLLESLPGDPRQLNEISSSLTTAVTAGDKSRRSFHKAKSFKERETRLSQPDEVLKRTGSFSRFNSFGTGTTIGSLALSQGSQVSTRSFRDTHALSWTDLPESQESFVVSPPPLPPRPPESSSDEDDPDYAYIDENKVKGPNGVKVHRTPSNELDDKLNELRRSIQRENKAKRREAERRKVQTLNTRHHHVSPQFVPADPQDYLIPIPSKQSTSSENRDLFDLSPTGGQELSSSPTDNSPVFVDDAPSLPPRTRMYGVNENIETKVKGDYSKDLADPAPPIPPRSPTRDFLTRKSSSSSSLSSSSSSHHRCPKCRSLRKGKSSVIKTVSLEPRTSPRVHKDHDSRKSMPNLETELRMRHHHHHCCESLDSSSDQLATPPSSREYLQLMDGPGSRRASELGPELDLLSSCLQTLEVLSKSGSGEGMVTGGGSQEGTKKKRNPYDHINVMSDPSEPTRPPRPDMDTQHQAPEPPRRNSIVPEPPRRNSIVPEPPRRNSVAPEPPRRVPDLPHRANPHRPLTSSQSAFARSSGFNLSQRYPGGTVNGTPRSAGDTMNGHMTTPRSLSSLRQAPPIPPRGSAHPESSRQNGDTQTLGRSATKHIPPPRSSSVLDHTPSYHGNNQYGGYSGGSQVEGGNSSTVFIHHLKDRRLAHMV